MISQFRTLADEEVNNDVELLVTLSVTVVKDTRVNVMEEKKVFPCDCRVALIRDYDVNAKKGLQGNITQIDSPERWVEFDNGYGVWVPIRFLQEINSEKALESVEWLAETTLHTPTFEAILKSDGTLTFLGQVVSVEDVQALTRFLSEHVTLPPKPEPYDFSDFTPNRVE